LCNSEFLTISLSSNISKLWLKGVLFLLHCKGPKHRKLQHSLLLDFAVLRWRPISFLQKLHLFWLILLSGSVMIPTWLWRRLIQWLLASTKLALCFHDDSFKWLALCTLAYEELSQFKLPIKDWGDSWSPYLFHHNWSLYTMELLLAFVKILNVEFVSSFFSLYYYYYYYVPSSLVWVAVT
jgi:hypothetical protein